MAESYWLQSAVIGVIVDCNMGDESSDEAKSTTFKALKHYNTTDQQQPLVFFFFFGDSILIGIIAHKLLAL